MDFGVFLPLGGVFELVDVPVDQQWERIRRAARRAEELGFCSVWLADNFHTIAGPTRESVFEALTAAAAVAEATSRIRIGHMCLCNGFRPPSYLAKATACLDVIAAGRLDVGIGAGWSRDDFERFGYPFPSGGIRVAQLREAVRVLQEMWSAPEANFEGEHFAVDGAINLPRPIQRPRPPLWIAGAGPKSLRVVAEHADWANFGVDLDDFRYRTRLLHEQCEAVTRDPLEIGLSAVVDVFIADEASAAERMRDRVVDRYLSRLPAAAAGRWVEHFAHRTVAGTPDRVVDALAAWRDAGCRHVILSMYVLADELEPLELLADSVMPQLTGS